MRIARGARIRQLSILLYSENNGLDIMAGMMFWCLDGGTCGVDGDTLKRHHRLRKVVIDGLLAYERTARREIACAGCNAERFRAKRNVCYVLCANAKAGERHCVESLRTMREKVQHSRSRR